jgi:hypothetical protein
MAALQIPRGKLPSPILWCRVRRCAGHSCRHRRMGTWVSCRLWRPGLSPRSCRSGDPDCLPAVVAVGGPGLLGPLTGSCRHRAPLWERHCCSIHSVRTPRSVATHTSAFCCSHHAASAACSGPIGVATSRQGGRPGPQQRPRAEDDVGQSRPGGCGRPLRRRRSRARRSRDHRAHPPAPRD